MLRICEDITDWRSVMDRQTDKHMDISKIYLKIRRFRVCPILGFTGHPPTPLKSVRHKFKSVQDPLHQKCARWNKTLLILDTLIIYKTLENRTSSSSMLTELWSYFDDRQRFSSNNQTLSLQSLFSGWNLRRWLHTKHVLRPNTYLSHAYRGLG